MKQAIIDFSHYLGGYLDRRKPQDFWHHLILVEIIPYFHTWNHLKSTALQKRSDFWFPPNFPGFQASNASKTFDLPKVVGKNEKPIPQMVPKHIQDMTPH